MMTVNRVRWGLALLAMAGLAACGNNGALGSLFEPNDVEPQQFDVEDRTERSTIWDLFDNRDDPNTVVAVNRYLWDASLDVLNFLPVQAADPFTGVIVTGFGTPPGGSRPYRATVYVRDPALDARSLSVSLQTRNGPASVETVRAVEDAILTRARQLRIEDAGL